MITRGWLRSTVAALMFAAAPAFADTAPSWDPARTKSPASVEELKALQDTLKKVVDKVTPTVVAIQYGAGAGSGVIISPDGLVLTAAHVVTPQPMLGLGGGRRQQPPQQPDDNLPKSCSLMLSDGKTYVTAEVVGRNLAGMDSAILRIKSPVPKKADWPGADKGKWPAVELGDSGATKLGQWVVSLGHPGGPKKDRRPPVRLGQIDDLPTSGRRIVTNCTLVGGDSGGPLFDLNGKLIGIHSSIGGDLAQNFHVPTKMFQRDWDRMIRGDNIGRKSDAFAGIAWKEDPKTADNFLTIIDDTVKGSPAAEAGLQAGDKVVRINGHKITSVQDVDDIMTGFRSGQRVEITVERGDDTLELEIVLGSRKALGVKK